MDFKRVSKEFNYSVNFFFFATAVANVAKRDNEEKVKRYE